MRHRLPLGGAFFDGFSKGLFGLIPCAAQLVETNDGLVLIDTGYGTQDVRQPHPRLSKFFHALINIRFRMEETALHQVKALGYAPSDVRHIVSPTWISTMPAGSRISPMRAST